MTRHRGASRSSAYQPPAAHGAGDLRVDGELPPDLARLETELAPASLGLRLRVFVHARALDEQLARGASPLGDRALALRAHQLVDRHHRELLAIALESVLERAQRPASITDIVPLARRELIHQSPSVTAVARRLRDPRPIYAQGAAIVSQLVCDGTGPVFTPGAGKALHRALYAASRQLDGAGEGISDFRTP